MSPTTKRPLAPHTDRVRTLALLALLCVLFTAGCTPNNPYREEDSRKNIHYSTFTEPPKHLDPARAYSSDEYHFIAQIYEPPVEYHYLQRPYRLEPLTVEEVPAPSYYGPSGQRLPDDAPAASVARAVYEIRVRDGIMYQDHPAFARREDGSLLYHDLTPADLEGVDEVRDFPVKSTRSLTSDDYILQIKRLADPLVECPILPILEKYILGLDGFAEALRGDLERIRAERKKAAGAAYNQTVDERDNPIVLDYSAHELPGVERVDDLTYRIILKTKYPQFVYWLAMPFFSPMPEEALTFYSQGALADRNITLDRFPVGTGPYLMEVYNPNMEITLAHNENFHGAEYPSEGEPEDVEAGLLEDAGEEIPFIKKAVFKLEKEAIPRWSKFLQGYYDSSGITSDSFDQAVTIAEGGRAEPTEAMQEKGIRLLTSVSSSTMYMGFNMLDDVVGGYTERARKLRQAISIALDYEEYIEIFNNGRGIPAMSPLPPGIFGHLEGREGINPYVYDWDPERSEPVRKSIEQARRLLSEAGYPGGRDAGGRPLVITFDNPWTGPDFAPMISWFIKRLKLLGIQLENRTTDYNRFRDKMMKGNFQIFFWGWNADYPDPENFFFLLTSENGKVKHQGENTANYENPEFDALFREMENMTNTDERLDIIRRMTRMIQKDAPWVWGFHPVSFGLFHEWVRNVKPNAMANNTLKYHRIETELRAELREEWNRPVVWPLAALVAVIAIAVAPVAIRIRRARAGR